MLMILVFYKKSIIRMPIRAPPAGSYPTKNQNSSLSIPIKKKMYIKGAHSILLTIYESSRMIKLFMGGHDRWCINVELIKDELGQVKPLGYLIKVRYDILCSLDSNFTRGNDTKQIVKTMIQYIVNNYPSVKELSFTDISTKTCDNQTDVNLAIMTYLYTGMTWYEKNFSAYISEQSKDELLKYENKLNNAKIIPWEIMSNTIYIPNDFPFTQIEIKELYEKSQTFIEFFKVIYDNLEIADFCIYISSWIDSFVAKYFNNLQGLTYIMPIKSYDVLYKLEEYQRGGKRFTRKATRKVN